MSKDWRDRFWAKVRKTGGCWLWTAAAFPDGYGLFKLGTKATDGPVRAHRLSFELAHGRPPRKGLLVCHTCDNPRCVRPDHLWEGTVSENARDSIAKGRWSPHLPPRPPFGARHWNAKLDARQIARIRALYEDGATQIELAAEFGCSQQLISRIVRGEHR